MSLPTTTTHETKTLKVGDVAPDFTLRDQNRQEVTLSSFQGKQNVVLAFFPFAFSGTCSAQMPSYEAELNRFNSFDTQVIGISMDAHHSLRAWANQLHLTFPLLSDFYPQGQVVDLYGVRSIVGTAERALIVVDKQGIIRSIEVHRPMGEQPDNEVLFEALRKL